ncbi:MAG: tape measure protein [Pseudomonadota bacterium]|nr:tape measure protein [Pseudomonadota bacterium]
MSEQTVTLRLVGDSGHLVGEVKVGRAALDGLADGAENAGERAKAGLSKPKTALQSLSQQIESTKRQMLGLATAWLSANGITRLVSGFIEAADRAGQLEARMRNATASQLEYNYAMERSEEVARNSFQSINQVAEIAINAAEPMRQLGFTVRDTLDLTEALSLSLVASAANQQRSAATIDQFSKAMQTGVLKGQEFQSVLQNAPRFVTALEQSLGKTRAELIKMAQDGELTVAKLTKVSGQLDLLRQDVEAMPTTVEDARVRLADAWQQWANDTNKVNGITQKVVRGLEFIADNLDHIIGVALLLGKTLVTLYAANAIRNGLLWIANLNLQTAATNRLIVAQAQWGATTKASFAAAMKNIGGLGIAYNLFAAGVIGWNIGTYLREQFLVVRLAGIALVRNLVLGWGYIKQGATVAWLALQYSFFACVDKMRNKLADFVAQVANVSSIIPDWFGGEAIEGSLRGLESRLRVTGTAAEEYADALARVNSEAQASRALDRQIFDDMADWEIANEHATKATEDFAKGAGTAAVAAQEQGKAAKGAATDINRLREAQAEFARENLRMTAQLAGPAASALFEYEDAVQQARIALAKKEATAAQVQVRERLLKEQYDETIASLREQADVVGRVQRDYRDVIYLASLSAEERRVEEQVLRAIAEAEDEANRQKDDSIRLTEAQIVALRAFVTQSERTITAYEEHYSALQQWIDAANRGASNLADLLTDTFSGGIKSSRDFFRSLRDVFRQGWRDVVRTAFDQSLVQPIQRRIAEAITGSTRQALAQAQGVAIGSGVFGGGSGNGFVQAASQQGGFAQAAMGLFQSAARFFGFGGQQAGAQAGTQLAGGLAGAGVAIGTTVQSAGGGFELSQGGALLMNQSALSKFVQSKGAPWLAAAAGAVYGWKQGGDTAGKALGAAAYGTAAYAGMAAAGAGTAAMAAGGGMAAAGTAALGAIPVVGWIALAAIAVDKLSGGKLFGTKFKAESASQQFDFSSNGATGVDSVTEVRNRSMFRGRAWRTTNTNVDEQTQRQLDSYFDELQKATAQAAGTLGVDMPDLLAASFRREFDKDGNLKSEFGTIAGRVYREAQDAFSQRLVAENLLRVAMQAGSAMEINQLGDRYRTTPEAMTEYATLMLAVQSDIKQAEQLWTDTGPGSITRVVDLMEQLGRAGEALAETYQRVTEAAISYGQLMAGVDRELRTHGLNEWQRAALDIETQYREQVRHVNDLAKSLGLAGARSEDLAKIELLRAQRMADVQHQMEAQRDAMLRDFALSDYSPLTDAQKLSNAMDELRTAVGAGDINTANRLAQTALGLGRNLYASGADYNALYGDVTGLIQSIAMPALDMDDGTTMGELAQILLDLPRDFARELWAVVSPAPLPSGSLPPVTAPGTAAPLAGVVGTADHGAEVVALLRDIRDLQHTNDDRLTRLELARAVL